MGNKNRKARAAMEQEMLRIMRKIGEGDPYLKSLQALNQRVIDWHSGASGIKDIMKHPLMAGKLAPYQLAMQDRNQGLIGQGILGAKAYKKGGNLGAYAHDLALEREQNRKLQAAGMLEQSLGQDFGQASSNIQNIAGQHANQLNQAYGMAGNLQGIYNSRIGPNFLQGLLGGLAQEGIGVGMTALAGMI